MAPRETYRCIAPIDDGDELCGAEATEEHVIEDVVMHLCHEHAAEYDEDVRREQAN